MTVKPLRSKCVSLFLVAAASSLAAFGQAQPNLRNNSFYNWESPHVHPLDLTPDTTKLLAVNTANNSLEVFNVTGSSPVLLKSIPVGLDPVSVRARTNTEAWVVNVISDSVSIVDLSAGVVKQTLQVDDEPADVIFAGSIVKQAFVSCAQAKTLLVFDPVTPATPLQRIPILGEQARALAASPDGRFVYLAIFESGNQTTAVTGGKDDAPFESDIVRDSRGPYGGMNVPPNSGQNFVPAINTSLPAPPPVSMIVKKTLVGGIFKWLDDNLGDWSAFITGSLANNGTLAARPTGWDLVDRDVAIVDTANSNAVSYQGNLMNIVMAIAVNPATGEATVVGTDATNQIRYEPNLQSTFVHVDFARFVSGGANTIVDMNPHITYQVRSIPVAQRQLSIGDPRGIVWNSAGTAAYVTGMGSNNIVVLSKTGARTGLINIGQGPTGIVLQEANSRAFVLNKFDATISTIDLGKQAELFRTPLSFDPTPASIKAGRPFLYNTQINSGLGQVACASCHVDARWDRLAWDLGDPQNNLVTNAQGIPFHPMKGPLLTMTLLDTMQAPFFHWRGDRTSMEDFEGAFQTLMGADQPANESTIAALRAFLETTSLPPNPYRNLDNSYSTGVSIPGPRNVISGTGDANIGAAEFEGSCRSCHPGQTNRGTAFVTNGFGLDQYRNPPTWKNFYKRTGLWFGDPTASTAGFGFQQDGTFDSTQNHSRDNNLMAFMLSFNGGYPYEPAGLNSTNVSNFTHAAVGKQITLSPANPSDTSGLLSQLQALADQGAVGLVAKGNVSGVTRGYTYLGNQIFQSDRLAEKDTMAQLQTAAAASGSALTFTAVPAESAIRIGIDMDSDGILNGDDLNPTVPNLIQTNVALQGTATMSSIWDGNHGPAKAIDGNTIGYFDQNALSHSSADVNPWWQEDLGSIYQLSLIQLFNRIDCCSTRLSNVSVFVSQTPFLSADLSATRSQPGVTEFFLPGYAGLLPQIPMNLLGRYVRVQINSPANTTNYLQLAEVRIFGATSPFFSLSSKQTAVTVTPGASTAATIAVAPFNGFNSPVTFSVSGLPASVTASFNPASSSTGTTLTLTAATGALANSTTLTITGISGTAIASTTLQLSVQPAPAFTLSLSPATLRVAAGQSGVISVKVLPSNGFTGTVTFSIDGPDNAGTATFTPPASSSGSTLAISAFASTAPGTYSLNVIGTSGSLTASTPLTVVVLPPLVAQHYVPIAPCRAVDTRGAAGPFGAPSLPANVQRNFKLPVSTCGIPATATAYALKVTVIPTHPIESFTMWATGQTQPTTSLLSTDGRAKSAAATIPAGTAGAIAVNSSTNTNVVIDITGYFVASGSAPKMELAYFPVTPCRLMDTRKATGSLGGPYLSANQARTIPILSGTCGIPATAKAYALNFTTLPHQDLSYFDAWATGTTQPGTSILNAPTGTVTANSALVSAGTGGSIQVLSAADSDLLIDVSGYFATPATGGLSYYSVPSCRVFTSTTPVSGMATLAVGSSACLARSLTPQAFELNATVTPAGPFGFLELWPDGTSIPGVSTLNSYDASVTSNTAVVQTLNGSIDLYALNPTQLTVDISGYFAP